MVDRLNNVVPFNPEAFESAESESADLYQGVPAGAPDCPEHIVGEAKIHWDYMVGTLEEAKLLTKLDQGTLAHLCLYYAKAKMAQEIIASDPYGLGEFQKTPNGYLQLSPASVIFKTYSQLYNKLADKFLANPSVRQKVKIENPDQLGFEI